MMNNYTSLRRRNNGTFLAAVALVLCVAVSAAMLFSRLSGYSAVKTQQYIPLTVSNGATKVTAVQRQVAVRQTASLLSASDAQRAVRLDETVTDPGFRVEDADTVWEGQTNVEIFRVSYENGQGEVTVHSAGADKLMAPGTENEYCFTLQNTGDVNLDYTLEIAAWFSDGENTIPVVVRLQDYAGKYLLGSADGYADVLELNGVKETNSISAGYIAPYTLQWQWPFAGDDEYDTWLGNLAQDADITLTIAIRTTAEAGGEGGLPDTGDRGLTVPVAALVLSGTALLLLVIPFKRKREDEDAKK